MRAPAYHSLSTAASAFTATALTLVHVIALLVLIGYGCCDPLGPPSDAGADSATTESDADATSVLYCTSLGLAVPCDFSEGTGPVWTCLGITMVCPAAYPIGCTIGVCADSAATCPDSICALTAE
jgi:hypothetical protein